MIVSDAHPAGKDSWNVFVKKHYPPVGGFMHSWEWGEFQKLCGRSVERYYVKEGEAVRAAFMVVRYPLPGGFWYGYSPRGPVLFEEGKDGALSENVFQAIEEWARGQQPRFLFLRLEPPIGTLPPGLDPSLFVVPGYYVQPRHNTSIPLQKTQEELSAALHPSTRSNLNRAKRRGVTVEMKHTLTLEEYEEFSKMMGETVARNSGKNVYPGRAYFENLFEALASKQEEYSQERASFRFFFGYQDGVPAACHLVIFFGTTATYLHGASYSKALSSKVTTVLHWEAALEAKRLGLNYYDLGGIDEKRWTTLTDFKRQFRGDEFHYIGNIDIPIRKFLYHLYNLVKKIRHRG